ncbi:MAG TPA: hypothetical protein VFW38_08535 [Solirubrobacteraceae bacterium]|nr:hypothetical protein [Solirubrobacteraceae bacterium]
MSDRWSRLAPLTGVLFALIVVAAAISGGGETPKASDSAAKVVVYYAKHRSEIETAGILFALAFLVLVLFAGALRSYLRSTGGADGLGTLVLAGAVLMAAGAIGVTALEYGLAHNLYDFTPEAAKTLNFISSEMFLPVLAGGFIFGLCAGLAILRGAALPTWLGWAAIVIGVAALVPPVSFPALLALLVWSVVAAVLMYQRQPAMASGTGAQEPQVV